MSKKSLAWGAMKLTAKTMAATARTAGAVLGGAAYGVGLGTLGTARLVRQVIRARRAVAPEIPCPRGHRVSQYGVFECGACGGVSESLAWECPICGASHGWIACPTCGLAVRNPMLG